MDIGIDLGTTNSVLAYLRGGPEVINIKGRPLLPSAIAYEDGEWLVGYAAKNLAATKENVVTSPKRSMGTDATYSIAGKTYTPVDMSARVLMEIKKHAEEFLGEPVTSAVITIPAHFSHKQVEDTRRAAEQAGLKVGKLLAEPVAASATYGTGGEEMLLVFDLGGGTLDCTVVDTFDAKILGLSGDNFLGGDDFDFRIVDRMTKHLLQESGIDLTNDQKARLRLKAEAEKFKINLSEAQATQVEFVGKLGGKLCSIDFRLTRQDYNEMIKDLVDRALEKADEAVKRAELTKDDIDVVLLVGGSSMTPYVQERLAAAFGKPPSKRVDPMLAVGLGAAICTRDLPWDDKTHRVLLRSRAEVWSKPTYTVKGRTSPRSKIEVLGGSRPGETVAGDDGQFTVDLPLTENATNDITVQATTPAGETAKVVQRVRHDPGAGQAVEPAAAPIVHPTLPRNVFVGVKNDHISKLVNHGTSLPASGESRDYYVDRSDHNFTLIIPVYEGHNPDSEVPFGPLNTRIGEVRVECPPTPQETQNVHTAGGGGAGALPGVPVVITFHIDDSRTTTVECWFANHPHIRGKATISANAISREDLHIIERTETAISQAGERLRPDERARLNRKKQALIDLCELYWGSKPEDTRKQIIDLGSELRAEIRALEQKYKLGSGEANLQK